MLSPAINSLRQEAEGKLVQMSHLASVSSELVLTPFLDSLDHIRALELESTLMLALTWLRRGGSSRDNDDFDPIFPEICRGKSLAETQQIYTVIASENRRREECSTETGGHLSFLTLCNKWQLDHFERKALMLLLMMNAAPDFASLYDDCNLGRGKNGMEIGTLLAIIYDNLRDQLAGRRYFSVESTLIRNDLVFIVGDMDDFSNIMDEKVRIQERLARYILGDDNLYSSCFRFVKREKSTVNLDQVILPGKDKEELVNCMERYIANRDNANQQRIDDFYGYGTALVYLFHGPSGTGKTMLAKALAAQFDRTIYSLSADDMREMPGSYQEIIATLFREAGLQNGIVFFDECDDIFEAGSRASRALLIELEKAQCVVILATNRPVQLDPALERRISMKTYFSIPEADMRRKIWQALIPPTVTLADDIKLDEFAERYRFTGGLIRNVVFLALTAAGGRDGEQIHLNAAQLHFAAGKQTATMADEQKLCTIELPTINLDTLPLDHEQRGRLKNLAPVWGRLKARKAGLAVVISASNLQTAIQTAKGVAKECGVVVRSYDFYQVMSRNPEDRIADPVSQRKIPPLDYAFAPTAGDEAMTLFIDRDNMLDGMLGMKREKMADVHMSELLARLRNHTGLFCIVGKDTGDYALPPELSLHERLLVPGRDQQELHWLSCLAGVDTTELSDLSKIIDKYQLHVREIDFIVRQASILSTVRRLDERPSFEEINEVLVRFKGIPRTNLLFGEGGHV